LLIFLKLRQPGLDAAVINIAAHLDAHAADEGGVLREGKIQPGAMPIGQRGLDAVLLGVIQRHHALHAGGPTGQVDFEEALEMGEDANVTAGLAGQHGVNHLPGLVFIQQAVGLRGAKEGFRVAPGLLVNLHRDPRNRLGGQLLGGFVGQALLVVQGEDLAADLGRGLGDETDHFLAQLVLHPDEFGLAGFPGLDDDLVGGGDGLLRFLLLDLGRESAGFLDMLVGLGVGLAQEFLGFGLGLGEFLFDLLGVPPPRTPPAARSM